LGKLATLACCVEETSESCSKVAEHFAPTASSGIAAQKKTASLLKQFFELYSNQIIF
jgi:hypothetical protein